MPSHHSRLNFRPISNNSLVVRVNNPPKHPVPPGPGGDGPGFCIPAHAHGEQRLLDSHRPHGPALPDHVFAHVSVRSGLAIQAARRPSPLPDPLGQFRHVAGCRIGVIWRVVYPVHRFFPPSQLETGNLLFYESFLILGILVMCGAAFVIYGLRKPSWVKAPGKEEPLVK